jgi:ParB family transcriptional regulator, chromosome partitioning protein
VPTRGSRWTRSVGIMTGGLEPAVFKKRAKSVPKKSVSERMRDRRKRKGSGSERKAVAQTPAAADQLAAPSYTVRDIAINSIRVPNKLRVNPQNVERLVESIGIIGLRTPITIRPLENGPELAAGLDRLAAAKILGWKTIPCMAIRGGPTIARLWQIAENLHRDTLTALDEADQIAKWVQLTESLELSSKRDKTGPGRPESGKAKAARELAVRGKTEQARRKNIERKLKMATIDPAAKAAAREAGLDNNPSRLLKIAAETSPKAQLAMVKTLKAHSHKPKPSASAGSASGGASSFDRMKREWRKENVLRRTVWERATPADRKRVAVALLKFSLKN